MTSQFRGEAQSNISVTSDSQCIEIGNSLTIYEVASLQAQLMSSSATNISLLLHLVGEIDSAGLQWLLHCVLGKQSTTQTIRLLSPSSCILDTAQLFGVSHLFEGAQS